MFSALISSTLLLGAISRTSMMFWGFLGLPPRKTLRKPTTRSDNPCDTSFIFFLKMVHLGFNTGSIFTQLAKKYHPDTNPDDPGAKEKFAKLAEAYEVRNINIRFSSKCLELHFSGLIWFHLNFFFCCIK